MSANIISQIFLPSIANEWGIPFLFLKNNFSYTKHSFRGHYKSRISDAKTMALSFIRAKIPCHWEKRFSPSRLPACGIDQTPQFTRKQGGRSPPELGCLHKRLLVLLPENQRFLITVVPTAASSAKMPKPASHPPPPPLSVGVEGFSAAS